MMGWLRRSFGAKAAAVPPVSLPEVAVLPAAVGPGLGSQPVMRKPAAPPYVPNLPNAAGLAAQALSAQSRPLSMPEAPPAPAVPKLGADEKLVLLQVARGSPRRARPAVAAALAGITGDRPNLSRVPNRSQVARALHRLGWDPEKVAALLVQVDVLAGVSRRR